MRPVYSEAVRGRDSAFYRPGVGWVGTVRRRPGVLTRALIVVAVVAVGVLLWLVMSGTPPS